MWLIPLFAAGAAFAQDAGHSPEFEVASVKLAAPQTGDGVFVGVRGGPGTQDATRITYVNLSLRNLLTEAYRVRAYQVTGPDWIDTERYDITAKVAEGATKDQVRVMLQNLLADRLRAVVHHETRDFPIFELTVAKSGSKLQPSSSASPGMMMTAKNGQNRLTASGQTLETLARVLENEVGNHVVDKTGLTGTYDFTLDFVRAIDAFKGLPPGPAASTDRVADSLGDAPGLGTALQEQLGLRLEKARGPLDVIVVDRANKAPSDN